MVCKAWLQARSREVSWDLLRNAHPPDPIPDPLHGELWSWEASHSTFSSLPGEGETHLLRGGVEGQEGRGAHLRWGGVPREETRVRTGVEAARRHYRLPSAVRGVWPNGAP